MREEDLRKVLLVKAVEEADADGTLLPPADRAAAAREAMRGGAGAAAADEPQLMAARARTLFARIASRHPFVSDLLDLLGKSGAITLGLMALGALIGAGFSILDGTRQINLLWVSVGLFTLVAWNVAVYVVLAVVAARPSKPRTSILRHWLSGVAGRIAGSQIARSRAFNAPLAAALKSFANEWRVAAAPLLLAQATRAFHLAAAAVGIGLIAGLYVRGIAFDYRAGWESTFLGDATARVLLGILYGPASWLTGIPLPEASQLQALRWRPDGSGGESAARWIHLMAATTLIYIVVPRLLLAAWAGLRAMRLSLRAPLPPALAPYFRSTFAAVEGAVRPARAVIAPYACELTPAALAKLIAWVPGAAGGAPAIDARASVPYGEEERHRAELATLGDDATIVVLPFSLATTPEDENHGTVLAATRDWLAERPGAQLLVVIDEAPYAQRLAGAPERLEERRAAWRAFVEARGLEARFASLA
jgi:hypothetical protein